jgi:hypothetical protein
MMAELDSAAVLKTSRYLSAGARAALSFDYCLTMR